MFCTKPARFCLMFFNLSFLIIGFILMIIGLWTKFDPNFHKIWLQLGTEISAKSINSLWILLIFCGLFTSILGN